MDQILDIYLLTSGIFCFIFGLVLVLYDENRFIYFINFLIFIGNVIILAVVFDIVWNN